VKARSPHFAFTEITEDVSVTSGINEVENKFSYALYTLQAGTRTFDGFEILLESIIKNIDSITRREDGSFSHTQDITARNALSDTVIVMSYALLEGFFSEEYGFYIGGKKPKTLCDVICKLFNKYDIKIKSLDTRCKKINIVRMLRNSVVHGNGVIPKNFDKSECMEVLGEDVFQHGKGYPRISLDLSRTIVHEFKSICWDYSVAMLDRATALSVGAASVERAV